MQRGGRQQQPQTGQLVPPHGPVLDRQTRDGGDPRRAEGGQHVPHRDHHGGTGERRQPPGRALEQVVAAGVQQVVHAGQPGLPLVVQGREGVDRLDLRQGPHVLDRAHPVGPLCRGREGTARGRDVQRPHVLRLQRRRPGQHRHPQPDRQADALQVPPDGIEHEPVGESRAVQHRAVLAQPRQVAVEVDHGAGGVHGEGGVAAQHRQRVEPAALRPRLPVEQVHRLVHRRTVASS